MPTLIHERVRLAHEGKNPYVITRLKSGWVVIGDVQPLHGYCLLLSDPVVSSINDLPEQARTDYLLDTARIGDALLDVTNAYRINYETWGNYEQALHTHITPRYMDEPAHLRQSPAGRGYDWKTARKFDPMEDRRFMARMRAALMPYAVGL
jgi:diadenosine tetraphosphate (Ap4A) HIT family hydrolase